MKRARNVYVATKAWLQRLDGTQSSVIQYFSLFENQDWLHENAQGRLHVQWHLSGLHTTRMRRHAPQKVSYVGTYLSTSTASPMIGDSILTSRHSQESRARESRTGTGNLTHYRRARAHTLYAARLTKFVYPFVMMKLMNELAVQTCSRFHVFQGSNRKTA